MTVPERRRSSATTKAAITRAARERFATEGYERTTIRAIAADAGIDPAQVMRYFGTKAALFARAADVELRIPDLTATPREQLGLRMAEHFVDRWEQDETFTALLRASITHDVAAERLREIIDTQVTDVVAQLVSDPSAAGPSAAMIAGQVLGIALCRYVLRVGPVLDMPRAQLVERLGASIQAQLSS